MISGVYQLKKRPQLFAAPKPLITPQVFKILLFAILIFILGVPIGWAISYFSK